MLLSTHQKNARWQDCLGLQGLNVTPHLERLTWNQSLASSLLLLFTLPSFCADILATEFQPFTKNRYDFRAENLIDTPPSRWRRTYWTTTPSSLIIHSSFIGNRVKLQFTVQPWEGHDCVSAVSGGLVFLTANNGKWAVSCYFIFIFL